MLGMTERFLDYARNDSGRFFGSLHSLRMTGYVTLSEVEGVCHVERPTGVETSGFLDYARNDTICHVERPTGVETSRFLDYARNDTICHVERPAGVETSRFLDYARKDKEISRFADALSK